MDDALHPAALRAARLGVLGGSFDPVHRGHLHLCRVAREARRLDHVVFVPAARSPHKLERALAPAADRLAMLERALADEPDVSVWGWELCRPGPSYTVDTLRELRGRRGPDAPAPFLLLGTDTLDGLPDWRGVEEVLALARPVVVVRPGFDLGQLDALVPRLGAELAAELRAALVEAPPDPASSTAEREALRAGGGTDALARAVRDYAADRGLYRDGGGD